MKGSIAKIAFAGLCLLILPVPSALISAPITSDSGSSPSRFKSLAAKILAAPIDQLEIYRTHRA